MTLVTQDLASGEIGSPPRDFPLIYKQLRHTYTQVDCDLEYKNSFQLLVATILLAQSSESIVNRVTVDLFAHYPTPATVVAAHRTDIEKIIRPVGFYRQKAKYLQLTCMMLLQQMDGKVPSDLLSLTKLPGVSRKGANLIVGELWGKADGVMVDTNVKRVSKRLGLAEGKSIEVVERQLIDIVPTEKRIPFSRMMSEHGRRVCIATQPACPTCVLKSLCPSKLEPLINQRTSIERTLSKSPIQ